MAENIAIREEVANEIISWCKTTAKMDGGKTNGVFKEIHNGKGGLDSKSFKRWHFETETDGDSYYIYRYIDIQEIMAGWYAATVEIGVKRRKGMWQTTVAKIYDYVSCVDAVRQILALDDKLLDLALLVPRPS